jgi:hypothetical protein
MAHEDSDAECPPIGAIHAKARNATICLGGWADPRNVVRAWAQSDTHDEQAFKDGTDAYGGGA